MTGELYFVQHLGGPAIFYFHILMKSSGCDNFSTKIERIWGVTGISSVGILWSTFQLMFIIWIFASVASVLGIRIVLSMLILRVQVQVLVFTSCCIYSLTPSFFFTLFFIFCFIFVCSMLFYILPLVGAMHICLVNPLASTTVARVAQGIWIHCKF